MPIFTESKKVVMNEEKKVKNRYSRTKAANVPTEFKEKFLKLAKDCFGITNSMVDDKYLNKANQNASITALKNRPPLNRYQVSIDFYHDDTEKATSKAMSILNKYFSKKKENKNGVYFYTYSKDKEFIYVASFSRRVKPEEFGTNKEVAKRIGQGMLYGVLFGPILGPMMARNLDTFNQIIIVMDCIDATDKNKSIVENGAFDYENAEVLTEKYSPEDVITPLYEAKKTSYGDFYSNRENAMKIFNEFMDMSRGDVRRTLIAMGEAEHNQVITKLTSKLYDHIVKKTAEIDFGEIPDTKGDITKLSNYDDLVEVIALLRDIVKEYKQPTDPVDVLSEALVNVKSRKILFDKGFRYNCEFPCLMYNNVVLSIYTGVSFLIATCIEFIKSPKDETFKIALDRVAYAKTKEHILYDSLKKFNETCKSGDFDNAMNLILDKRVKKFTGMAVATIIGASIVGVAIVFNIIPILRELVYCSMYTRVRISDFFETQADLLQMNAYNVEHNATMDPDERRAIAEKQMAIAEKFRYISNKISIEAKRSDVESNKQLQNRQDKFSMEDLEEEIEITPSDSSSALF